MTKNELKKLGTNLYIIIIIFILLTNMFMITGIFTITDINGIFKNISSNLYETVISLQLMIALIINIILLIKEFLIRKNEIMYLNEIKDNICTFINKKGYIFNIDNNHYEEKNFYYVKRGAYTINKVIKKTKEDFTVPKMKVRYWTNLYTPFGNIKDQLIIPLIYLLIVVGALNVHYELNIKFGIITMLLSIIIIIIDYIYKNELKITAEQNQTKSILKLLVKYIAPLEKIIMILAISVILIFTVEWYLRLILFYIIVIVIVSIKSDIYRIREETKKVKIATKLTYILILTPILSFVVLTIFLFILKMLN